MSESKQAVLVTGDDWQGVYVDGSCVAQGYSVHALILLQGLGYEVDFVTPDQDWLEYEGYLPTGLKDLVRAK